MQINIEKRHLIIFGLIVGGILILLSGIFVWAYGTSNPAVFGHSAGEIGVPTCTAGQVLTYTSAGWSCVVVSSGEPATIVKLQLGGKCPTIINYTCRAAYKSWGTENVGACTSLENGWYLCAYSLN